MGLAQAKRELTAAKREAFAVEMDREFLGLLRRNPSLRGVSLSESGGSDECGEDEETASGLSRFLPIWRSKKSKCVTALKEAAAAIQEVTATLLNKTSLAETKALKAANERMSREMEDLRKFI